MFWLVPGIIPYLVVAGAVVPLIAQDPTNAGPWLCLVLIAPMMGVRVWLFRRARAQPWSVRIDSDGVTWEDGGACVSWTSVAKVEVQRAHRVQSILLRRRLDRIVLISHAALAFAARARSAPMGHVIDTAQLDCTVEQVMAAIRRFTDVPPQT